MYIKDVNSRTPDFQNDLALGEFGECFFIDYINPYLIKKGYQLIDISDNRDYWKYDIDFLVYKKPGDIPDYSDPLNVLSNHDFQKIEIKTDMRAYDTGNIPYEIDYESDGKVLKKGWASYTKCDYMIYVLTRNMEDRTIKSVVWLNMGKWRDFIDSYKDDSRFVRECIVKSDYKHMYLCRLWSLIDKKVVDKYDTFK